MVVRQSDDPLSLMSGIHSGEMITSSYTPTLEQRIETLQKRAKSNSKWDLNTKKDIVMRYLELKKEIIMDIKSIDSTGNTDIYNKMNGILQTWYNKKQSSA